MIEEDSPIQTELARLIKKNMAKKEQFNSFNVTGLYYLTFDCE